MHAPHDNGKRRLAKTLMIQEARSDAIEQDIDMQKLRDIVPA